MRMTEERAIEINDLLVRARMIREGIAKSGATVPSLASVSEADAVLASHFVEHLPPADGVQTRRCHVALRLTEILIAKADCAGAGRDVADGGVQGRNKMAQPKSESGQAVNGFTIAVYKGKVAPGEFHKHKPLRRSEPPHEGAQPSSQQAGGTAKDS